ncbi:MAG: hypothetical protein ACI4C0_07115 [Lachnospiraceae bacterium]
MENNERLELQTKAFMADLLAGVTFSMCYNENDFHNADKALYRTKETTRKGCTVFEEMD